MTFDSPQDALRYHVTGAVERGEKPAIVGVDRPSLREFQERGGEVTEAHRQVPLWILREIEDVDPQGRYDPPTPNLIAGHKAISIERYGQAAWDIYSAGGWSPYQYESWQ